jgi:AAHS family 4-hydroxybenzoate transporter-like MFS transporter
VQYVVAEKKREGVPVLYLFRDGRALGTVLLWVVNFMNLLNLYFLSSWLPTVVRDSGYSTSTAVLVGTTVQVGGTIAALGLGWFIGRLGFVPVLATCFAVASVNIAMIGHPGLPLAFLFTVVFLAGMGIVGGQAAINALAATYYPTTLRSTGIGWALGIGRIGAIVGPVLAGQFMALHWSNERLFIAAAVPALISALVMLAMKPRVAT